MSEVMSMLPKEVRGGRPDEDRLRQDRLGQVAASFQHAEAVLYPGGLSGVP